MVAPATLEAKPVRGLVAAAMLDENDEMLAVSLTESVAMELAMSVYVPPPQTAASFIPICIITSRGFLGLVVSRDGCPIDVRSS